MRAADDQRCRRCNQPIYVPLSVRDRSRIVTWLWKRLPLSYEQATWLAKRLP